MRKPWSISTTVRNPERLRDFLKVLEEVEGQPFNHENQIKFQVLLIKHRLYKPTELTSEQREYFDDVEADMPLSVAEGIFHSQNYEDPAMRGRNSVAPINKMGLAIAKAAGGPIQITDFGNYFLSEDYDLGQVFFSHFLKWQLPNPDSHEFPASEGFAIKPFIGALHLIRRVNEMWQELKHDPVGITKEEFSLFALTLINYKDINEQAEKLMFFRLKLNSLSTEEDKNEFRNTYKQDFASEFLDTNDTERINRLINNLKDYGDNAIRYFRLTRYIYIRGGGFYIDLEPRRKIELDNLLKTDSGAPSTFANAEEYVSYLADMSQPTLPWETEEALTKIISGIQSEIKDYEVLLAAKNVSTPGIRFKETSALSLPELNFCVDELRDYRLTLQQLAVRSESQDIAEIEKYILDLKNIFHSKERRSVELERLTTLALNALNDALQIKPNYPVGDDNNPTFTAPGNKPDIECFYQRFNSICEVTMLTGRDQWYSEGIPVQRHLRAFENAHSDKPAYCIFIAPKLHEDTLDSFWAAIKMGYQGLPQRIIPLSINQLVDLLDFLVTIKSSKIDFSHENLLNLYNEIINLTNTATNTKIWMKDVPETINAWKAAVSS